MEKKFCQYNIKDMNNISKQLKPRSRSHKKMNFTQIVLK